jgi:hypothetical protein
MENRIIIIMLKTGEILVTGTDDVEPFDDTVIEVLKVFYPAMIIPIPQQAGQIGFQKYFPFSDNDEDMEIRKSQIATLSTPVQDIERAYGEWVTQVKAKEAGLIIPGKN